MPLPVSHRLPLSSICLNPSPAPVLSDIYNFLENAQHYAQEYRTFIVDTDSGDPESLHLIGVREGISQKPVSPESIPSFEDTISLSKDFNTAAIDLLLLVLFFRCSFVRSVSGICAR